MRYLLIILFSVVFFSCERNSSLPYMGETYDWDDKIPFGMKVAEDLITEMHSNIYVSAIEYKLTTSMIDTNALYFSVTNSFDIEDEETNSLLSIIEDGNTAFISSNKMSTYFLSSLGVKMYGYNGRERRYYSRMMDTGVWLDDSLSKKEHSFFHYTFSNSFYDLDSTIEVLGYNMKGEPNFIKRKLKEGTIYLHAEPRVFSNYFLLTGNNYQYLNRLMHLIYTDEGEFYFDRFHGDANRSANSDTSYFSELFKHPALKAATLLFIFLFLIYVLSESRRKRAIIPVIKPKTNASIAFTETIARLYYQKRDNKNIALKMILYFNEYIRNKYYFQGNEINVNWLSRKSGIDESEVQKLVHEISDIKQQVVVDDAQLARLNNLILKFYKQ